MPVLPTNKVNAKVSSGEHLSGDMEFYVLNTLNALTETNYSAGDAGQNLLRVLEIVQLGSQAVTLGLRAITGVDLTSAANRALYGMGTAIDGSANSTLTSVTVYQLRFAIEKAGAWTTTSTDGTVAGSLAHALVSETALAALPVVTTAGATPISTFVMTGVTQSSSLTVTTLA